MHVILRPRVPVLQITPAPPPPPVSHISGAFAASFAMTGTLTDGGSNLLLDGSGNILTDGSGNPLTNA